MKKSEITDRVEADKERREQKLDANLMIKPNMRQAAENRRKVEMRRSNERRIAEKERRQNDDWEY